MHSSVLSEYQECLYMTYQVGHHHCPAQLQMGYCEVFDGGYSGLGQNQEHMHVAVGINTLQIDYSSIGKF